MSGKRCLDSVNRRCPLFAADLVGEPRRVLVIDTLHTLYLGTLQVYIRAVVWRIVKTNPWKIGGSAEQVTAGCFRMLHAHLAAWYSKHRLDVKYRLGDVTPKMFGSHETGAVTTKAAETGPLVQWCVQLLCEFTVLGGEYLLPAGQALSRHMKILKSHGPKLPREASIELLSTFQRHVALLRRTGVGLIPKHHLWLHLICATPQNGNPRFHSTFLDESLNGIVGLVAQAAHQKCWEARVFSRLQLMPVLDRDSYFASFK